ncbi:methyltransferase domain-containing protein [Actinoplanes sp. CA-131856]
MTRPDELTDLLWSFSPDGTRLPADISSLRGRPARLARRLLASPGLDDELLRVHFELQRLGEELQLPRRVAETLQAWVRHTGRPMRVVDIGCGLGYVIRWLAAHRVLGPSVSLVGVDFNPLLIARASALAAAEGLDCRFIAGDALRPGLAVEDGADTIVISSGLVHHLSPADLPSFFAAQQALGVHGFAHWDIDPSVWSTLGAWVFHRGRMRSPVSRHDGVLSARRAHTGAVLAGAARAGAPAYDVSCVDAPRWRPRVVDVLRPVTGLRAPA